MHPAALTAPCGMQLPSAPAVLSAAPVALSRTVPFLVALFLFALRRAVLSCAVRADGNRADTARASGP